MSAARLRYQNYYIWPQKLKKCEATNAKDVLFLLGFRGTASNSAYYGYPELWIFKVSCLQIQISVVTILNIQMAISLSKIIVL
jgi:hypothetical protein